MTTGHGPRQRLTRRERLNGVMVFELFAPGLGRCAARGFSVFGQGSDVGALKAGLAQGLAMLRELPPPRG